MKRILIAAAALALIGAAATPASAQVYLGADPGGVGVAVGPWVSASARIIGAIATTATIATTPTRRRSAARCVSAS